MRRYIIFTGGATQKKTAPDRTEAELMYEYVVAHCDPVMVGMMTFFEEESYTTFDNISLAADLISRRNPEYGFFDGDVEIVIVNGYGCHLNAELTMYLDRVCQYLNESPIRPGITIFCETSRSLKVLLLAWYFFSGRHVTLETVSWELASPVKELCQTIWDFAACYFRPLAMYARNKRIKRSYTI